MCVASESRWVIRYRGPSMIRPRLVQHFAFHVGERGDAVVAPAGWGKSTAVRDWLDAAGDAADTIWLAVAQGEPTDQLWTRLRDAFATRGLPPGALGFGDAHPVDATTIERQTFVVLDDLQNGSDPMIGARVADLIERAPPRLNVVLCSRAELPPSLRSLVARRVLRLTGPDVLAFDAAETQALLGKRGAALSASFVAKTLRDTSGKPAAIDKALTQG